MKTAYSINEALKYLKDHRADDEVADVSYDNRSHYWYAWLTNAKGVNKHGVVGIGRTPIIAAHNLIAAIKD